MLRSAGITVILFAAILAGIAYLDRRIQAGERRDDIADLIIWALFSIVFTILPLLASATLLLIQHGGLTLAHWIGGGELLIVASTISADSLGRLLAHRSNDMVMSLRFLVNAGACALLMTSSALLFGAVSSGSASMDQRYVAIVSVNTYILAVLFGGSCVSMRMGFGGPRRKNG